MNEKKNAASLLAQESGTVDNRKFCSSGITSHRLQSITKDGDGQGLCVAAVLPHGKGSAVPARKLCTLLGISDDRVLRRIIERERASGALILSAKSGYFLPSLDEAEARREVAAFVRRSDARLKSNRASVRAAKRWLRRQRELPG